MQKTKTEYRKQERRYTLHLDTTESTQRSAVTTNCKKTNACTTHIINKTTSYFTVLVAVLQMYHHYERHKNYTQ